MIVAGRIKFVGSATASGGLLKTSTVEIGDAVIRDLRMEQYMYDRLDVGNDATLLVKHMFWMRTLLGIKINGTVYKASSTRYYVALAIIAVTALYFMGDISGPGRGAGMLGVVGPAVLFGLPFAHVASLLVAMKRF